MIKSILKYICLFVFCLVFLYLFASFCICLLFVCLYSKWLGWILVLSDFLHYFSLPVVMIWYETTLCPQSQIIFHVIITCLLIWLCVWVSVPIMVVFIRTLIHTRLVFDFYNHNILLSVVFFALAYHRLIFVTTWCHVLAIALLSLIISLYVLCFTMDLFFNHFKICFIPFVLV